MMTRSICNSHVNSSRILDTTIIEGKCCIKAKKRSINFLTPSRHAISSLTSCSQDNPSGSQGKTPCPKTGLTNTNIPKQLAKQPQAPEQATSKVHFPLGCQENNFIKIIDGVMAIEPDGSCDGLNESRTILETMPTSKSTVDDCLQWLERCLRFIKMLTTPIEMIYRSKDVNGIDEKEYLCNYCDCQSFKDESKYHEHLLSHMFKCEECDFYSMTRFEILNHVHYSHPSRAESILSTYWVKQNGQERYSGVSGFIDNEHSRNKQLKNIGSSNASYDTNQSADKGRHFQAEEALKEVSSTKPQPSKGNTFQKGRKKSKRYHLNVENKQLFEPINYSGPIRPNDGEKLTNGYKRNSVITNSSNIASDEINDGMFEPDMTLSQNSSGSFDSTDSGCSSENVSTSSESFDDSFQVFDEMLCENKTKSPVEQKEKTTTSSYQDSQGPSSFKNVAVAKLRNNFQSENHNSGIDSPNQSSRTTSYCKITSQTCPKRSSEVGILEGLDKPDVGSSKGYVKDNLDEIQNKPRDGRTSDVLNLYHPGSSGSFHDTKSDDEDETTSDPNPSESSYESSSDELVIDESHDDTDINSTYFSFTSRHLQTTNKDDAGFSAPKNVKNVDDHSGKQLHSRLQTNGSHYSAHPFANDYSLRPQMKDVKISNLRDNFSPRSPRSVSSQEKNDLSFPSINSTNSRNFLIERSMKMLGESKRPKRRNDEASDSSNTKKKKIE